MAGGRDAVFTAGEGNEDDPDAGVNELKSRGILRKRCLLWDICERQRGIRPGGCAICSFCGRFDNIFFPVMKLPVLQG